jgi:hypothetical protein
MDELDSVELLAALKLIYLVPVIDIHLVSAKNCDCGTLGEREYLVNAFAPHNDPVTVKLYCSGIEDRTLFLIRYNLTK